MDEHASTPDGLWLAAWLIANAPWLWAGLVSGVVRIVYRWGVDRCGLRSSVSEGLLCGAFVSVLSPVAASVGLNEKWSMVAAVLVGFAGPEAVRSVVVKRLGIAAKALFKGHDDA